MSSSNNLNVIIMAGGLGKRMKSTLPKVLHKVDGLPMVVRVILEAEKLKPKSIMIVVGQYKDIIEKTLKNFNVLQHVTFVIQEIPKGTGHAIQCAYDNLEKLDSDDEILILSGDTPLISSELMRRMLNFSDVKIMTTIREDATGYGRVKVVDKVFQKIVEHKDCNQAELLINQVNCGIYAFKNKHLVNYLDKLDNNNEQKEYYLTDMIEIIKTNAKVDIEIYNLPKDDQWLLTNVNDKEQLEFVNEIIRKSKLTLVPEWGGVI